MTISRMLPGNTDTEISRISWETVLSGSTGTENYFPGKFNTFDTITKTIDFSGISGTRILQLLEIVIVSTVPELPPLLMTKRLPKGLTLSFCSYILCVLGYCKFVEILTKV